jgi:Arc/MetJ-type ribon-helix-helix transcriptional regulator
MSAEDDATSEPPEMVPITLRIPAQILSAIDEDVADGMYADTEEGLRHSLVESWRHH